MMLDSKIGFIINETAASERKEATIIGDKSDKLTVQIYYQKLCPDSPQVSL